MKAKLRPLALLTALALVSPQVLAQSEAQSAGVAAPAAKTFSQQELDQILAPIALYPDALLAQIFMASTYPLDVVQAARWSKANPKITGKALEDAMAVQPWDPAVKSLTAVPQVLQQMNDKLDWTQKLGDAFLAQQADVMDTVQGLRAKAAASGNLKSTEQQVVKTEHQGSQTIYIIESSQPQVVYVPTYNPTVVYGTWPYAAPPYYVYPPGYAYAPGLTFAAGMVVGAAIWGNCNWGWGRGDVDVNVNQYNNFNRTNISEKNWNHNVENRRGVAYQDRKVAEKYNRGSSSRDSRAREDFRGRAESGRGELKSMDRTDLNNRVSNADRNSRDLAQRGGADRGNVADRGSYGDRGNVGNRAGAGNRGGGGFSDAGRGAATREASHRGSGSRAAAGGGGGARAGGGGGGARAGGGGGRGGGGRR